MAGEETVAVAVPAGAAAATAAATTGGVGTTAETATAIVTVTAGTMVIATGTAAGGTRATGPPGTGAAAAVEGFATETGTVTGVEGSAETLDGELICRALGLGCLLMRGRNRWLPYRGLFSLCHIPGGGRATGAFRVVTAVSLRGRFFFITSTLIIDALQMSAGLRRIMFVR